LNCSELPECTVSAVNVAFSDDATNGEVLVGTTVTAVLSGDSGRTWGMICNDSSATEIYLYFGPTSASLSADLSTGVMIDGGDCFDIDSENLWLGQIWGIASGSAASISYTTY